MVPPSTCACVLTTLGSRRVFSRLLAVVASLAAATAVLAEGRYYNSDSTIQTSHPDWMSWVPDSRRLSEISIPGTHDSMSLYGGAIVETQGLSFSAQLQAGIRNFDIRALHEGDFFAIFHGCVFQDAYFGEILYDAAVFLAAHPTETIIMALGSEGTNELDWYNIGECFGEYVFPDYIWEYVPRPNTREYEDTFKWYRDQTQVGSVIWNPLLPNDRYPNAVAGPNYTGQIPELGEVRGKIVIIQGKGFPRYCTVTDCNQSAGNGWKYPETYYGIENSQFTLRIYRQFEYEVDFLWEIDDLADEAIDFLTKTNAGSSDFPSTSGEGGADALYLNNLAGVGAGAWPPNVAGGDFSGAELYDGVNEIVLWHLIQNVFDRTTGVMRMDFPGAGLIDAIIAQNFRHSEVAADTSHVAKPFASDFEYLVNNVAYNGTDIGGDEQALDRVWLLQNFLGAVLPFEFINVVVWIDECGFFGDPFKLGYKTDRAGLFKETDWIDTDNIFETREYKAIAFNRGSYETVYENAELEAYVDYVRTLLTGHAQQRADQLHAFVTLEFPDQLWTVLAKSGCGGFDNWAFTYWGNFYKKPYGDYEYVVWGTVPPASWTVPIEYGPRGGLHLDRSAEY